MGDEFTMEGVEALARSICRFLIESGHSPSQNRIIVGYDTRKNSNEYADAVARIASSVGFHVLMPERDSPTPVIANAVKYWNACGGIMITASHNPPDWNGVKFIPYYAGPANEEITSTIQQLVSLKGEEPLEEADDPGRIERIDPFQAYFEDIRAMLGAVVLSRSDLKIVYDPMHGTGRGYVDRLLSSFGVEVITINGEADEDFGGVQPDPSEEKLGDLMEAVQSNGADLGLATDGDADRIGAVAPDGTYVSPNMLFPLLASKIQDSKRGGIVRTVATTSSVDALAQSLGVEVHEVPVGFKYIAPYLMDDKAVIGGEESGGFGYWDHVPEKDGILTSLRTAELLAQREKSITELLEDFFAKHGRFISRRTQVPIPEEMTEGIKRSTKDFTEALGQKPAKVVRKDGLKAYLDNKTWLLLRPSGTEPVVRIYAEAESEDRVLELLEAGKGLISGD
jgi:phosphomannomutase